MSTFTNQTGLQILQFINGLKIHYGRINLAKMVWHEFGGISIDHAKDMLAQLTERGYVQELNVGTDFAMYVLALTDKGKTALNLDEQIVLDFQRFYEHSFHAAADVGVVDRKVIEEYYHIKRALTELQKREEELKETIKRAMIEKNTYEIRSDLIDFFCKKVERVAYPKEKIERFVPESILEKIRTVNEIMVLTTKFKEQKNHVVNEVCNDQDTPDKNNA